MIVCDLYVSQSTYEPIFRVKIYEIRGKNSKSKFVLALEISIFMKRNNYQHCLFIFNS